jgi:enoyl-CoA hydratase
MRSPAPGRKTGLVLKSCRGLDAEVEARAKDGDRAGQSAMMRLVVNQAIEAMGLKGTQLLATVFDGITRHSPEGLNAGAR